MYRKIFCSAGVFKWNSTFYWWTHLTKSEWIEAILCCHHGKLFIKQQIRRWFKTIWRSCDVAMMVPLTDMLCRWHPIIKWRNAFLHDQSHAVRIWEPKSYRDIFAYASKSLEQYIYSPLSCLLLWYVVCRMQSVGGGYTQWPIFKAPTQIIHNARNKHHALSIICVGALTIGHCVCINKSNGVFN